MLNIIQQPLDKIWLSLINFIYQIEVSNMADYKKMYIHLMQSTEHAIRILIQAQRDCEELYISAPETKLTVLDREESTDGGAD